MVGYFFAPLYDIAMSIFFLFVERKIKMCQKKKNIYRNSIKRISEKKYRWRQ